ncbi:CBU_0592 family membrane protein [Herbidospora sp. RD11066]
MSTFITVIGVVGAIALLIAYGLVSTGKMTGDSMTYQAINLTGAVTLAVNSAYHGAWPSAILNIVWTAIGVFTVGRLVARRAPART